MPLGLKNRSFSPQIDFERLARRIPQISLGQLYSGSDTRIDCSLLESRTRWGRLDSHDTVILHLAMSFSPPDGHQLRKATVLLRFASAQEDLPEERDVYFPSVTDCHPKRMQGPRWDRQVSRRVNFAPNIEAAGVSVGLGELETNSEQTEAYRWYFDGGLSVMVPGHTFDSLRCEWRPQAKGDSQPERRIVEVGVVLLHGAEPFLIHSSIVASFRTFRMEGFRDLFAFGQLPSEPNRTMRMPAISADVNLQIDVDKLRDDIERANLKHGKAAFPGSRLRE